MRKALSIVLAGILVAVFCSLALAEEQKGSMMGKGMRQGGMMDKKDMMMQQGEMMGMRPMHGMMMKMMMGKSLVATQDGGVVVMVGNKLFKYDKNLNLKKEVGIKMDMEGMQNLMKQMKEECPMYKKMMQEGGMMGRTGKEPKGIPESEEPSEHESHH